MHSRTAGTLASAEGSQSRAERRTLSRMGIGWCSMTLKATGVGRAHGSLAQPAAMPAPARRTLRLSNPAEIVASLTLTRQFRGWRSRNPSNSRVAIHEKLRLVRDDCARAHD